MTQDFCLDHSDPEVQKWFTTYGVEETYRQALLNDNILPKWEDTYSISEAKTYLNNFIPSGDLKYANIKSIIDKLPVGAQAAFWKDTFYFKDSITKGELGEEAFHAIISTILSDSQREEFYRNAKAVTPNLSQRVTDAVKRAPETYIPLSSSQREDRVAEEYVADLFKPYFISSQPLTLGEKFNKFFQELFEMLKDLFGFATDKRSYIDALFQDILAGKYRKSRVVFSENTTPSTYLAVGKNASDLDQELSATESEQILRNLVANYFALKQQLDLSKNELIDETIAVAFQVYTNRDKVVAGVFKKEESYFDLAQGKIISTVRESYTSLIDELNKRIDQAAPLMFDLIEEDQGDIITDENSPEYNISEFNSADEAGFNNISGWVKQYIKTVGVPLETISLKNGVEIEWTEAVDENRIYYGVARALNNSKNDFERLIKLVNFSTIDGNYASNALLKKLIKDATGENNVEAVINNLLNDYNNSYIGDASIINKYFNGDRAYVLQNILKAFDLWSRTNLFQSVSPDFGSTYTTDANVNNAINTQIAKWQQASLSIDSTVEPLKNIVTSVGAQGEFYQKLNKAVFDNTNILREVLGVDIHDDAMKWLLINALPNTTILNAKDKAKYNAFKDTIATYGSVEEIKGLLGNFKSNIKNPKEIFDTQNRRLELLAKINATFDESVFESSYTAADGQRRYGFQWKTFDLEFVRNLQDTKFLTSLMNNGLVKYRVDSEGNDVYLNEGQDFLHKNIFLEKFFDKTEDGGYVLNNSEARKLLPYFQLVSVDGIRQTFDSNLKKQKLAEFDKEIQNAVNRGDQAGRIEAVQKRAELEALEGIEGNGVTFSNILTRDFDLYRLNLVVNKSIVVNGITMYPHYIGNLEAKRTADFIVLPEITRLIESNGQLSEKAINLLKEEVRKEYDRIKRVHNEFATMFADNAELFQWEDNKVKVDATLLKPLLGKDIIEKYHTGTITRTNKNGEYVYTGIRALEFSDSVSGILPKSYMKSGLRDSALENVELNSIWNNTTLQNHWNNLFEQHYNKIDGQGIIPLLDGRWKNDGVLDQNKFKGFILSSFINVLGFNQLVHGDPAIIYKNDGADMYKRFGGRNAAIQSAETYLVAPSLGITEVKQTMRYVVANEMQSVNAYEPFQVNADGTPILDKEGRTIKNGMDQADAQNYGTVEYKRYLLWSRGRLTPFLAKALDNIELGIPLTEAQKKVMQDNGEYFNVDKTVAFNGVQYQKKSDFMLTKEFTSKLTLEALEKLETATEEEAREIRRDENNWIARHDTKFHHDIRQNMEGWRTNSEGKLVRDDAKKYDLYMPISASKMFNANVYNPATGWNNTDDSIMQIDAKNYGLQLENPGGKERIIDPSQMIEIIFNEQDDKVEVYYKGEKRKVADLGVLYQQYLTKRDETNFLLAYNEVFDENDEFDAENFFPKAVNSLLNSGADPQTIKIFESFENGKPEYNPNIGITKDKFVDLLFAHFTKGVLQQKVAGDAQAHVSSYGIKPVKKIIKLDINGVEDYTWDVVQRDSDVYNQLAYRNVTELKLESTVKDRVIYDPTLPTHALRDTLKEMYEQGNIYFTDELRHLKPRYEYDAGTSDVRKVKHVVAYYSESLMPASKVDQQKITNKNRWNFAVRIPSQDKHSAVNVEWVDVMPFYYGNSIITAKEVMSISGHDYDIDKLFMHKPELYKLGSTYYKYGEGDTWVEYIEFLKNSKPDFRKKYNQLRKTLNQRDLEVDEEYNSLRDELALLKQQPRSRVRDEMQRVQQLINDFEQEYIASDTYIKETLYKPVELLKSMRLPTDITGWMNPYKINNELLDLKQLALTNDGTLKSRIVKDASGNDIHIKATYKTAATMDSIKNLDEEGSIFRDEEGNSIFNTDNDFPAHIFATHSLVHTKNTLGKQNINPFVNGNLGLILAIRAGYEINLPFQFTINGHTAVRFEEISQDNQRVFDTLSSWISAATDEAKEQLNAKYGITLDGAVILKTLLALGFQHDTSVAFVSQPVIQEFLRQKEANNSPIYAGNKLFKNDSQIIQDLLGKNEPDTQDYGNEKLSSSLLGDVDPNFNARLLLDLETINKISDQLTALTRFLKVKKGFSGGLEQLDKLNEAISSLGFDINPRNKKDVASFAKYNPINTHKTYTKEISSRIPQVVYAAKAIVPVMNAITKKVLLDRQPQMLMLKSALSTQFRNLNSDLQKQVDKDVNTYLSMRLYLEEAGSDLLTDNLFVKGEDHSTVGETFIDLKSEVNRVVNANFRGEVLSPDEKILLNLGSTSILKRLTVKTNENIDELKLDTFARLSVDEQDTLITSYGEMIKNLRYLSDDYLQFKNLPEQLFAYWVMKDGFQNKYGSIAKLFPVYMFKDHSHSIDRAIAGTSDVFNQLKEDGLYDVWLKDILTRLAKSASNNRLFKNFYSGQAQEVTLHNSKYFIDLSKLTTENLDVVTPYPFEVAVIEENIVIHSVALFVKTNEFNPETNKSTPTILKLRAFKQSDGTVVNDGDPQFYSKLIENGGNLLALQYGKFATEDIFGRSIMTKDMNYTGLESNENNPLIIPENVVSLGNQTTENQEVMNANEFTNYSGAAQGSDTIWENIGKEFGIGKQVNYRPENLQKISETNLLEIENAYQKAVKDLNRRPLDKSTYAGGLVRRDYLQAKAADAIFAISSILKPGQLDKKGYSNKTNKEIVEGGTGYAVQMAINLGKPVFVFDQNQNKWFTWNGNNFIGIETPILTKKYSGVGTREIQENGKKAIRDVYNKTFNQEGLTNGCSPI